MREEQRRGRERERRKERKRKEQGRGWRTITLKGYCLLHLQTCLPGVEGMPCYPVLRKRKPELPLSLPWPPCQHKTPPKSCLSE